MPRLIILLVCLCSFMPALANTLDQQQQSAKHSQQQLRQHKQQLELQVQQQAATLQQQQQQLKRLQQQLKQLEMTRDDNHQGATAGQHLPDQH